MNIPTTVSFEEAIAHTHQLMEALEQEALTDAEIEHTLAQLVSTENGARGFFVTYLTDDRPLADHPSEAVLTSLKSSPDIVSELLVKNLAMSSAMAIAHRRNNNEDMAQGSDRVRTRTLNLVQQLQLPQIATKLQQLNESATTGQGVYQSFLDRWNYDAEQRQVIQVATQEAVRQEADGEQGSV
ncbi:MULTISPECIES: hypothetical protein [unclassified Leptolyngbya]|uniref:hypothetical protein n=1 Tax=unclassified Leptolyngbya TaxID=2650499 RepID=UPI001684EF2B|nr:MULTISPECIES: hypothetical protein [unclassified Leptolyngbya]MBD1910191.1 hypothetical protein [Leptolyngbya sp. FACHB-8]MBD2153824.1 hypothetical protein [Leptolyngbya sp. FACHB-16]